MASKCAARVPSPRWASRPGLVGSWVSVRPAKCGASGGRAVVCAAVSFRPCIDIHKGKVKQIVGSTLRDSSNDGMELVTNFESDKSPAEFAKLYKEDELLGGHVIMLGADPASQAAALEALHAYPGGLQVGGGINLENAMSYLNEGASHVIVTSIPLFPQKPASLVRTRFIEILSPVIAASHLPYYSLVQVSTTAFCLFLHANVICILAASISSRWTCKFVVAYLPLRNTLSPFLDSPYSTLGLSIFLPWLGQYP